jgi:hypothetical protein
MTRQHVYNNSTNTEMKTTRKLSNNCITSPYIREPENGSPRAGRSTALNEKTGAAFIETRDV